MSGTAALIVAITLGGLGLASLIEMRTRGSVPERTAGVRPSFLERLNSQDGFVPKDAVRILVSLLILAAALYVILSKEYDDATEKWAYGSVGTVLGYWLPSS